MPQAGFEPTIPVFEQSKTVRVLERTATGTGLWSNYSNTNLITLQNITVPIEK